MNQLWIILVKEIRDNLRDKQSLFYSLVFGPILMPMLMFGPLIQKANKQDVDFERPLELRVAGGEHAPNLLRYLKTRNIDAVAVDGDYADRIRSGEWDVVLEIPPDFGEAFSAGEPAPLTVYYNSAGSDAGSRQKRLKSALDAYNAQIRGLRYFARGIDEFIFTPLSISERDLSPEISKITKTIILVLPVILLLPMVMGGLYLAVDITAGERERLSLEPLLSLPIKRSLLVFGKYGAILSFVLISMVIPLIVIYVSLWFLSNETITSTFDFSGRTFLIAAMLHFPVALMMASVLLFIAAFARSTKEAQALLGAVILLPLLPAIILGITDVPRQLATIALPLLGQYQILGGVIIGESVPLLYYGVSMAGALLVALVLLFGSIQLYSKESILH
jgi:sodium transport system permease protein